MTKKMICGQAVTLALPLVAALALAGGLYPRVASAAERVGGAFALERVDLRFSGGEKVRVLVAGQKVRAEVDITFAGTGQLGGAWEIAEPGTTAGSPRFRTLELVSRLLSMGRREVIASPLLPTAVPGAYLLRMRITTPEVADSALVLRYFVGQPAGGSAAAPAGGPGALAARGPAAGSGPDGLRFSWQPVAGSIAYQLEIFEKNPDASAGPAGDDDFQGAFLVSIPSSLGRPPLTGVMVPGTQTEVVLGPATFKRLAAGTTYLWRVVALNGDGKVVGDSPLKELVR